LLDDEAAGRVARARANLSRLGTALQRRPLDPMIHDALRAWLETDAAPAVTSLEELRAFAERQPDVLREQILLLTAYVATRVLP